MYVCSWAVSEIGPKLNILFIFFVGEIQVRLFDGISCSVGSNDMDICYYGTLSGVSLILPPPILGLNSSQIPFSVGLLAKRLAGKSVSKMSYFVLSGACVKPKLNQSTLKIAILEA